MAMTEAEWLASESTDCMYNLACTRGVSARKLRLIVCAYCRSVWDQLPDDESRAAVEMGERYADGLEKEGKVREASWSLYKYNLAKRLVELKGRSEADAHLAWLTIVPSSASALATLGHGDQRRNDRAIQRTIASLYRHIIGNPFRFPERPAWLPATVIQLADALYHGQNCGFALHDALLDAGHAELADHFRDGVHPKGCWAVDLLLGKG